MRHTHATASDFARNNVILDFHQRQMKFILANLKPRSTSTKICEAPNCELFTGSDTDPLCEDHVAKFIDNLLERNQEKLECTDCYEKISHAEYEADKEFPLCTNCGYLAYK